MIYFGHTLLLSVSHVTNDDDLVTFLETNLPPKGNTTPIKPTAGLVYYDVFNVTDGIDLSEFENLVEKNGERIDVTFAKIKEHIVLKQLAMDFGSFKIENRDKIILDLDETTIPDKEKNYSFYGKVGPEYNGIYLRMTSTLKHSLKFQGTNGYFHML